MKYIILGLATVSVLATLIAGIAVYRAWTRGVKWNP